MSPGRQIAIDVMGGEAGVSVTVPASLQVLKRLRDLRLYLVGNQSLIQPYLESCKDKSSLDRITTIHTACIVRDEDKPSIVLREKSNSSMYLAVDLVRSGQAQACVSAGNTGALLLSGRHLLKTINGIDKPAIIATIPGATSNCFLLDVGANVDCKATQLFQFAVMGSVLAESIGKLARARVGLLNIGVEDYKGNEQVRLAANLLEQCESINYIGFVEGSDLYSGRADVVVCDGFVGNVTIKSSAGVVKVFNQFLNDRIANNLWSRISALISSALLRSLHQRVNPSQFNGASLLGLQGCIIKSHSNASSEGFAYAIEQAAKEADLDVPGLIAEKVARIIAVA